jgi:hypothetical protein
VTTTRWNTTYSNPIDNTYETYYDVDDWCSAYATGPYVVYDDLAKGTCGKNATWVLYKSGQLVISGTGKVIRGGWTGSRLTRVLLQEGITSISPKLFYRNSNITSVILPSTMSSTGSEGFRQITNLTYVYIPEGVKTIDWSCFRGCTRLPSITLPSTITAIANYAFSDCSSLASMTVLATTPPTLGTSALPSASQFQAIYVPAASVDAYKTAWSNYASVIQAIQE